MSFLVIVSLAVLILLVLIVVLLLWKFQKACFSKPRSELPEQVRHTTEAQTATTVHGSSIGVGPNFGPPKPLRLAGSRDELNEPLLKSEAKFQDKADGLEEVLCEDEMKIYEDEGSERNSKASSLSSLDTYVSEKDWLETLLSFGPKFKNLADMVSEEVEDSENVDGSEV